MMTLPPISSLFPGILDSPTILQDIISEARPVYDHQNAITVSCFKQKRSKDTEPTKCSPVKIKFSQQEDNMLIYLVRNIKPMNWNVIAYFMGSRTARQCRDRWKNYLNPELRNDPWTEEEDKLLFEKQKIFGSKWGKIAHFFSNRSDNSCRNRWQHLARQLERIQKAKQLNSQNSI